MIKVIEGGKESKVYHLGPTYELTGFDLNAENFGLNRRSNEGIFEYIVRVYKDPIFSHTSCDGLSEGCPKVY